jgi:DNA-binding MarR family transcriptional regulator
MSDTEKSNLPADAVDRILDQWHCERPDLDVSAMGVLGRLARTGALVQKQLTIVFAEYELSHWEFDVLATLRRSGQPYRLSPTALFSSLMLSSGTMTRQLQQLESRGLIERVPNPADARSMLVQLSTSGFAMIEKVVAAHAENQQRILQGLDADACRQLDAGLKQLLLLLESRFPLQHP